MLRYIGAAVCLCYVCATDLVSVAPPTAGFICLPVAIELAVFVPKSSISSTLSSLRFDYQTMTTESFPEVQK